LTSHVLSEIEMVCDRVGIVDGGRVVRSGQLSYLIGGVAELAVTVDRVDAELLGLLASRGEITRVRDCTVTVGVDDLEVAPVVADAVVRAGYRLYGLAPSRQSLGRVFAALVGPTLDR